MNKIRSNENLLSFNRHNLIPFLDGIDIFLCFSVITNLCIFFFPTLDVRSSIIVMSFLTLLTFFSRFFSTAFISFFFKINKKKNINFFLILSFCYLLPILSNSNFLFLSLILLVLNRLLIGMFISQINLNYKFSQEFTEKQTFFVKYFLFFIIGSLIGNILFMVINDILSNDELNTWGWKIIFVLLFIINFSFFLFFKITGKLIYLKYELRDDRVINNSRSDVLVFFKNIFSIIPIFLITLFCASKWLPKFANPENMQFLDFGLINILLIGLTTLFIYPLIILVGRKKTSSFLFVSVILISFISIFFKYNSSYSIDFVKFSLSVVASFSICLFYLDLKFNNEFNPFQKINIFNLLFLLNSFLIPLSFYYFINFSISYNILYLTVGLIYSLSFFISLYVKKTN